MDTYAPDEDVYNGLTPQDIIHRFDAHVVGQPEAKKRLAMAIRERWRHSQLKIPSSASFSVLKNILLIGSSGVGKAQLVQWLAHICQAPLLKINISTLSYAAVGRHAEALVTLLIDQEIIKLAGSYASMAPFTPSQDVLRLSDHDVQGPTAVPPSALTAEAVRHVEAHGLLFLDEIDQLCESYGSLDIQFHQQTLQRALLPILDGETVITKYGPISTRHIILCAAGTFMTSQPSDLLPRVYGKFLTQVHCHPLTTEHLFQILMQKSPPLAQQYQDLFSVEGITLTFAPDGAMAIAAIAFELNRHVEDIGARRLAIVVERMLQDLSFYAPERRSTSYTINSHFVHAFLQNMIKNDETI